MSHVYILRCSEADLDIQPDHPDLHSGLLRASHADNQHPLPAHRHPVAQGEESDHSEHQERFRIRRTVYVPQAQAEQTEPANHQNAV